MNLDAIKMILDTIKMNFDATLKDFPSKVRRHYQKSGKFRTMSEIEAQAPQPLGAEGLGCLP